MFFNPPEFPERLSATRQVTCICCQQTYVLTDTGSDRNPGVPQRADIDLFFQPDRRVQPASSPPFAPVRLRDQAKAAKNPGGNSHVNCPRCGADNRNWVEMLRSVRDGERFRFAVRNNNARALIFAMLVFGFGFVSFASITLGTALSNLTAILISGFATLFVAATVTLCISFPERFFVSDTNMLMGGVATPILAFLGFLLLYIRNPNTLVQQALLYGIAVFVGGVLPVAYMPKEWRKVLTSHRLQKYLPATIRARPRVVAPNLQNALALVLLTAIFAPLLIYFGLPLGISVLFGPLENDLRPSANLQVTALQNDLDSWLAEEAETAEEIRTVLTTLDERLGTAVSGRVNGAELGQVIAHLQTAVDDEALNETDIKSSLQNRLSTLRELATNTTSHRFILIWMLSVGGITALSSYAAFHTTRQIAQEADGQLPPPIYHSLADMTRVVTWEAKIALELADDSHLHIQWIRAERNETGGLRLRGLQRSPATYDDNGRLSEAHVRAHHHVIESDIWGRIISARTYPARVPPAPETPIYMASAPAQTPVPEAVRRDGH